MNLKEDIYRIGGLMFLNEDDSKKNARLLDNLIKAMFGDLKQIKFLYGGSNEYFWIKNYDDNIDYNNMSFDDYVTEYGEDDLMFTKNNWGKLWITNCEFYNFYKDNFISQSDVDTEGYSDQKHYKIIKDYFKEKYNVNIKMVSNEQCEDDWW